MSLKAFAEVNKKHYALKLKNIFYKTNLNAFLFVYENTISTTKSTIESTKLNLLDFECKNDNDCLNGYIIYNFFFYNKLYIFLLIISIWNNN